jgi:hypothetical protein
MLTASIAKDVVSEKIAAVVQQARIDLQPHALKAA